MSLTSRSTTSRPALWARAAVVFLGVGAWMGCNSTPAHDSSGEAREAGSSDILREGAPIQVVEQGYFEYTERGKLVQALEANRLERWDNPEDEGKATKKTHPCGRCRRDSPSSLAATETAMPQPFKPTAARTTTKLAAWKRGTTSCW